MLKVNHIFNQLKNIKNNKFLQKTNSFKQNRIS